MAGICPELGFCCCIYMRNPWELRGVHWIFLLQLKKFAESSTVEDPVHNDSSMWTEWFFKETTEQNSWMESQNVFTSVEGAPHQVSMAGESWWHARVAKQNALVDEACKTPRLRSRGFCFAGVGESVDGSRSRASSLWASQTSLRNVRSRGVVRYLWGGA